MKVYVPGPLRTYTRGASLVDGEGATLEEVLAGLDTKFPGMRFRMIDEQGRIRQHIRLFVNSTLATKLRTHLRPGDEVHIICALSGG